MDNSIKWFFLTTVLIFESANSQDSRFINPGAKIGYTFGLNNFTITGVEVSLTAWPESRKVGFGLYLSIDRTNSFTMYHFGGEVMSNYFGFALGPSITTSKKSNDIGLSTTLFGGFIVIPYCRYTFLKHEENIKEIGTFIKIPIFLSGPQIKLGG